MRSISASRVLISSLRPSLRLICFTANSSPVDSFNPLNTCSKDKTRDRCTKDDYNSDDKMSCPETHVSFSVRVNCLF